MPDAKVVISVPAGGEKLTMHRFDVDQALEQSGIDYLLVTSAPPASAKKGAAFEYALAVKSKKGGLKYHVESGPKGLAISTTGKVTRDVPADFDDKEVAVIVSVTDSAGQEAFHTFKLAIRE